MVLISIKKSLKYCVYWTISNHTFWMIINTPTFKQMFDASKFLFFKRGCFLAINLSSFLKTRNSFKNNLNLSFNYS